MKITVATGKVKPVHVPAAVLLALTDALHMLPEASFEEIVKKAQWLRLAYEAELRRNRST